MTSASFLDEIGAVYDHNRDLAIVGDGAMDLVLGGGVEGGGAVTTGGRGLGGGECVETECWSGAMEVERSCCKHCWNSFLNVQAGQGNEMEMWKGCGF